MEEEEKEVREFRKPEVKVNVKEEDIATFRCDRNGVWFDLKLWMKGEELKCVEKDVMKIVTQHFTRVDGKADPRKFGKSGRPLWNEKKKEEKVDEEPEEKEGTEVPQVEEEGVPVSPFISMTKVQLKMELDKLDVPYDESDTKPILIDLLEKEQRLVELRGAKKS
jgi:hypothetical protein